MDVICDKGVKIVVMGKWDNFVIVLCNDSVVIGEIVVLFFVCVIEKVWVVLLKFVVEDKWDFLVNSLFKSENYYGFVFW